MEAPISWVARYCADDGELRIRMRGGLFPPDLDPIHQGRDGYRRMWERTIKALTGHGAGSGVPVNQRAVQLFHLRGGLVIRQDDFADRSEALEALGMSE